MPYFFEIFRNAGAGIFFLQLLNHTIHQNGSGFLFKVTQLACKFARKRKRLPVNNREFLPELFVLSFDFLGDRAVEFAFMNHL